MSLSKKKTTNAMKRRRSQYLYYCFCMVGNDTRAKRLLIFLFFCKHTRRNAKYEPNAKRSKQINSNKNYDKREITLECKPKQNKKFVVEIECVRMNRNRSFWFFVRLLFFGGGERNVKILRASRSTIHR